MTWIFLECEARVIYSLRTGRQPVIYWETNHLLARFYFSSNTQETTKRQVYPADVSSSLPLREKKSHQDFDCNRGIYMYFLCF